VLPCELGSLLSSPAKIIGNICKNCNDNIIENKIKITTITFEIYYKEKNVMLSVTDLASHYKLNDGRVKCYLLI